MKSVLRHVIICGLCLLWCECCQYIPRLKDASESLLIKHCDQNIQLDSSISMALKRLILVDNWLKPIIGQIGSKNLEQLEYLEFRENGLINLFEANIRELANLKELRIKESQLDLVLYNLPQKEKLAILEVESKSISSKINFFSNFPKTLKHAFIVNTRVTWESTITYNSEQFQLQNLTMRNCSLKGIALHPCEKTLTDLDLSQNQLKNFRGLGSLLNLRFFNISHNLIKVIEEIDFIEMTKIDTLILGNNLLEYIPANSFEKNSNLRELDISYNKLLQLNLNGHFIGKIIVDGNMLECDTLVRDKSKISPINTVSKSLKVVEVQQLLCSKESASSNSAYGIYGLVSALIITIVVSAIIIGLQQRKIRMAATARKSAEDSSFGYHVPPQEEGDYANPDEMEDPNYCTEPIYNE